MNTHKRINPAVISVVAIASDLRRSFAIPRMPKSNAAGNENIISNPPRTARGLPQPGLHRSTMTNVAPAMTSRAADIFPKRISFSDQCSLDVTEQTYKPSWPAKFIASYSHSAPMKSSKSNTKIPVATDFF